MPRAVLFGNPEKRAAALSPDGKYLAWLAPKDGVMNIYVAPVGKLDQAKPITDEKTRPIRNFMWAFTSKHLVFGQDVGGDENFHVFRAELAGGKVTDLTPQAGARAQIEAISERSPTKLLVSINDRDAKAMDLHAVDLVTGKHTMMVENVDGLSSYEIDDDLKVRLVSKKLPDGATELLAPEVKAGKTAWRTWDTIPFEDADNGAVIGFSPTGKAVYMVDPRGRDTGALVEIDLATKQKKVLAEDARADAGGVLSHPQSHALQAVSFEYDRTRWQVLDSAVQKDLDALAKVDGGEVTITSRTLDDKWWTVMTVTEQQGGRTYLWDRAKQQATLLFAAQPELAKQPLVKMWPKPIKARDGLTLMSYLSLPRAADADQDGKPERAVPMVLLVHGGPWARDRWGFNPLHQLLANRGYAVLSVNYRGSTGFGKKHLNAANLQWGKAMHTDLLDAVAWAVTEKITPANSTCIMGGSYGGYATLAGLTLTPDAFRCGVDIVGPSNLMTLLSTIPPYWRPLVALFHSRMGNPETAEGRALLTEVSPLTHAARIKKPLLIAQGKNDPRVKEAESEQIVAAMKQHNLPVSYVLFPDEGHGFARPANSIAFYAVAEAFLSAHLGGVYAPITKDELAATTMIVKEGKAGIPGL